MISILFIFLLHSASSVSSTVGDTLSGGNTGYPSSSAVASSSKTSLQIQQQTAGGYGSEGSKVQVATGQAYHHPQHAANTPPPAPSGHALAAYMANLAGQQTLGGAPVAAPQAAAYPASYLPAMMQPTAGHHLLQQLQQVCPILSLLSLFSVLCHFGSRISHSITHFVNELFSFFWIGYYAIHA